MRWLFILLLAGLGACNNGGRAGTRAGDTIMRGIDSSQLINNRTNLPYDSTATGVTH